VRRLPVRVVVSILVIAWSLAACGFVNVTPPGWRQMTMTVENKHGAPARLFVARDEHPMGPIVGTAVPSVVPAGVTQDVVFTVPPDEGWAIFVNPSGERGPLLLASDLAGRSGKLTIIIGVEANGEPYSMWPD
jgi:hypothetical protein